MKELIKRLLSEPADFFKPIIKLCVTLSVIGLSIQALPIDLFPAIVFTIGKYFMAAGIFGGAIAKATVNDAASVK